MLPHHHSPLKLPLRSKATALRTHGHVVYCQIIVGCSTFSHKVGQAQSPRCYFKLPFACFRVGRLLEKPFSHAEEVGPTCSRIYLAECTEWCVGDLQIQTLASAAATSGRKAEGNPPEPVQTTSSPSHGIARVVGGKRDRVRFIVATNDETVKPWRAKHWQTKHTENMLFGLYVSQRKLCHVKSLSREPPSPKVRPKHAPHPNTFVTRKTRGAL